MHEYHLVHANELQRQQQEPTTLSPPDNNNWASSSENYAEGMEASTSIFPKDAQDLLVLCRVIKKSGLGPRSRQQQENSEVAGVAMQHESDNLVDWNYTTLEHRHGNHCEEDDEGMLNFADHTSMDMAVRTDLTLRNELHKEISREI